MITNPIAAGYQTKKDRTNSGLFFLKDLSFI